MLGVSCRNINMTGRLNYLLALPFFMKKILFAEMPRCEGFALQTNVYQGLVVLGHKSNFGGCYSTYIFSGGDTDVPLMPYSFFENCSFCHGFLFS